MTPVTNLFNNLITNSNIEIVISPVVLSELIDSIDTDEEDVDMTMKVMVQEIIDRAKIFINQFQGTYFLNQEPIHEFTGLEFRDPETSQLQQLIKYRLVVRSNSLGIFSVDEVPIDDMYDIRLTIAESQLPAYHEN